MSCYYKLLHTKWLSRDKFVLILMLKLSVSDFDGIGKGRTEIPAFQRFKGGESYA